VVLTALILASCAPQRRICDIATNVRVEVGNVQYVIPTSLQPDFPEVKHDDPRFQWIIDSSGYVSPEGSRRNYCQSAQDAPWTVKGFDLKRSAIKQLASSDVRFAALSDVDFLFVMPFSQPPASFGIEPEDRMEFGAYWRRDHDFDDNYDLSSKSTPLRNKAVSLTCRQSKDIPWTNGCRVYVEQDPKIGDLTFDIDSNGMNRITDTARDAEPDTSIYKAVDGLLSYLSASPNLPKGSLALGKARDIQ
jgi:hypothetical protein